MNIPSSMFGLRVPTGICAKEWILSHRGDWIAAERTAAVDSEEFVHVMAEYRLQAEQLYEAGANGLLIVAERTESMSEIRAAVLGARMGTYSGNLPITAYFSGKEQFAVKPCLVVLESLGVRCFVEGSELSDLEEERSDSDWVLACEDEIFFLKEEQLEISEPLGCAMDMADELLEAEDSLVDVVCILLENAGDAVAFALNAKMCKRPIMFRASDEGLLREALMLYNGVAIVDACSLLPEAILTEAAETYGCPIY